LQQSSKSLLGKGGGDGGEPGPGEASDVVDLQAKLIDLNNRLLDADFEVKSVNQQLAVCSRADEKELLCVKLVVLQVREGKLAAFSIGEHLSCAKCLALCSADVALLPRESQRSPLSILPKACPAIKLIGKAWEPCLMSSMPLQDTKRILNEEIDALRSNIFRLETAARAEAEKKKCVVGVQAACDEVHVFRQSLARAVSDRPRLQAPIICSSRCSWTVFGGLWVHKGAAVLPCLCATI
jgi:hypothetical protein